MTSPLQRLAQQAYPIKTFPAHQLPGKCGAEDDHLGCLLALPVAAPALADLQGAASQTHRSPSPSAARNGLKGAVDGKRIALPPWGQGNCSALKHRTALAPERGCRQGCPTSVYRRHQHWPRLGRPV